MKIEHAQKDDAEALAYLINLAGEGIPFYLWSLSAKTGQTPLAVGIQRAARDEGGFSYRNASVIKTGAKVVGMMLSYRLADPYLVDISDDVPEVVRPLILLESKAPGSWYVNAIATLESHRGKGIASTLLQEAEVQAIREGASQMSLIVASDNVSAKALYSKLGYAPQAALPVVRFPGCLHGGNWELMTKPLSKA